ncbi:hypothetical protein [Phenylobacterium sp.]|uniref:hypothetical protein n=1 Tax=Phenylobacterium sp. TaxID=1871053 RepID=UPI002ED96A4E
MAWRGVPVVVGIAILAGGPAAAGVHPPEVEARLALFAQNWTIEGMEGAFREDCEWYHDRSFVVCHATEVEDGKTFHSVSVLGFSSRARTYTYLHYSSTGGSRTETGYPTETGGLVFLGERQTAQGFAQTRSVITPNAAGPGFLFEQTRALNGGEWKPTVKFKYVTRGPAK